MFNLAMNFLSGICGCTIVLSSATQPVFDEIKYPLNIAENAEISGDHKQDPDVFKRTDIISALTSYGYDYNEAVDFCIEKYNSSGDKAKLISSNDESGFTYRGRFSDKEETISVSYEFSQKAHNALKWLISRQGRVYDSATVVTWASSLDEVPSFDRNISEMYYDKYPLDTDEDEYDTQPAYSEMLDRCIFGYKRTIGQDAKIMIMGLDAATTGRLSISMYSELESSAYIENIAGWHSNCLWYRYDPKMKKYCENSFSIYEIAKYAFCPERDGKISESDIPKGTLLRLIPCVTEGRRIVTALCVLPPSVGVNTLSHPPHGGCGLK